MPIQRSVLANLESGRRTTVTIAEVLVLAAALNVPPAILVFPVGQTETVEMLPDFPAEALEAVDWLAGVRPRDSQHPFSRNALFLYRRHRQLARSLRNQLREREDVRAEYIAASGEKEALTTQLDYAKAQARQAYAALATVRERRAEVPGDDERERVELAQARAAADMATAESVELERRLSQVMYLEKHLGRLDRLVQDRAMDLLKVRMDMADQKLLLPRLRDDVWGVLEEVSKHLNAQLPLFEEVQEMPEE